MSDLTETLAEIHKHIDSDPTYYERKMLSAIESVLTLCDEYEQPRHTQEPLTRRIRKALTDALA